MKFGLTLLAAFALGAVAASVSQGAVWNVNGTNLANGESRESSLQATENFVLESKVLGQKLRIEATGVEGSGAKIVQSGTVAQTVGKLVLTGVSVAEPAGCSVTGGKITTAALQGEMVMGNTEATLNNVYEKISPASGEVLATISIAGCAIAGSYQLKGNIYCLNEKSPGTPSVTNTSLVAQPFRFSSLIQSSQGGVLSFGSQPAIIIFVTERRLNVGLSFRIGP
jgi:hypothetical protein